MPHRRRKLRRMAGKIALRPGVGHRADDVSGGPMGRSRLWDQREGRWARRGSAHGGSRRSKSDSDRRARGSWMVVSLQQRTMAVAGAWLVSSRGGPDSVCCHDAGGEAARAISISPQKEATGLARRAVARAADTFGARVRARHVSLTTKEFKQRHKVAKLLCATQPDATSSQRLLARNLRGCVVFDATATWAMC